MKAGSRPSRLTRRGRLVRAVLIGLACAAAFAFGLTDHHCYAPASGHYERCLP